MRVLRLFAPLALVAILAPLTARADLAVGIDHYQSGRYQEAEAELQAAVQAAPDSDSAHYMLGLSLLKLDRAAEAVEHLRHAVELNPQKYEYQHSLGAALYEQKNYAEAIAVLERAEPAAPDDEVRSTLLGLRGMAHAQLEHWEPAMADLQRALQAKPSPGLRVQLARAQMGTGKLDEGRATLRAVAGEAPEDPAVQRAVVEAIIAAAGSADPEQGKALYVEAMGPAQVYQRLQPGFEASFLLGQAALGAGQYPQSEQALSAALAEKPGFCPALLSLGMAQAWQEKWPEAERNLSESTRCAQQPPAIHEALGYVQIKQNKLAEALASYQAAHQIQPTETNTKAIEALQARLGAGGGSPQEQEEKDGGRR